MQFAYDKKYSSADSASVPTFRSGPEMGYWRQAVGGIALALVLVFRLAGGPDETPVDGVAASQTVEHDVARADILEDIIDILDDILGDGGSGNNGGPESGT